MVILSNVDPGEKVQISSNSSSLSSTRTQDVEALKNSITVQTCELQETRRSSVVEISKARDIQNRFALLRVLRAAEVWLDSKFGVETRGVERIPEEEKQPPSIINIFLLWWSLNVHIGALPLGILGPQFGLSFSSSIAATVVGTCLGALCTSFTGTLSPKLGLRQIACSRYSYGYWGAMVASVTNIIIGCGYNIVNFVIVGQILSAVADYKLNITVGIVIIGVISYIVSIFGYKTIHTFEKYSWMYTLILLIVLVVQAAPHVDTSIPSEPSSGLGYAASFLTLLAINFSAASSWCSIAGDYYCNYPSSTNPLLVFALTWSGIVIPTCFSVMIGIVIGNATLTAKYEPYATAYEEHFLGGLLRVIYQPLAWSKTALVLLMFSVLGNNIANFYSTGLSLQLLGSYFLAVPRFIWSLLAAITIAVIAIAGDQQLSAIIADFVSMLGYWTISFTIVLLVEDRVFRRTSGYNLKAWNQPSELPVGAAAILSLLAAYFGGGMSGMSQTWYVGPIARKFSEYGGDVGIWLSGAITLVVYPVARTVEKKMTGR